jgi:hypothetical protein
MSEAQSGAVDRRLAAFPDFAALHPGYEFNALHNGHDATKADRRV